MTAAQTAVLERSEERILSIDVRRDGVAVVTIDDGREDENTITMALQAQLLATIARIDEDASIAAVVLTSGKPASFVAGLNGALLMSIKFATDAERIASEMSLALKRLEGLRKPVVAAVHGSALGGGFEIALACHAIVASDDPRTVFGLPDVQLGLVPAANGVLRVANRAGLRTAIELGAGGEPLRASAARELGLVDDVCSRAILLDAAARHAKALVGHVPRVRDERGDLLTLAFEKNRLGRRLLFKRAREELRDARVQNPAPGLVLDALERLADKGFEEAARFEAKAFGDLVVSETAHRLIEMSLAIAALEKDSGLAPAEGRDGKATPIMAEARGVQRLSVIGGDPPGSGIAAAAAEAGIAVRLKERDDPAVGRTLRAVRAHLDARVGRGELTALDAGHVFARVSGTTDFSGVRNAHAVIEALPDDLALKQETLRDVEALVGPHCVYGSCSAWLPIGKIAQSAVNPERVLGMHYFEPVAEAPLLEVVRGDKTASWAVATAAGLGKMQKKTVIVVKDMPGYYTTRVLAPLLYEAVLLVAEGVPAAVVDAAVTDWGFGVGPLQLMDDRGIDTVSQIAQGLHAAFGARMTPPGALATLVADERRGRKNGRGIYKYDRYEVDAKASHIGEPPRGGRDARRAVDPAIYELLGVEARTRLPLEEVALRCALALVNEAVRCFGDGILRDPRDGDVGAVFGLGFPRARGGPFRYVDTIGAADVLRRVQGYADRFGERWRPAPLLVQMAKKGERFFA